MTYIIVIMTTPKKTEAEKIIRKLLEEKLIACGNILEGVSSLFWWKEKIEQESETLILMKSDIESFEKITQRIEKLHKYDVPEILALPVLKGSQKYLDWMKTVLKR